MTLYPRLDEGTPAPAFTLSDDTGTEVSLSDFAGQRVLLYFYPKANTPGCTKQACDFRDSLGALNDAKIQVLGISPDSPAKLAKFRSDHELNFPLLADEDNTVMQAYGAYGEKKNYGRVFEGVIRSTFVIDEQGNIEKALYNVKATGHVARVLKDLGLE